MKKILLLTFSILLTTVLRAQDLFFEVKIDASTANTTDARVFSNMQNAFEQFLNDRNWVEESLEPFERIKAVMAINIIKIPQSGKYEAKMQIQSIRPVYNSTYPTIMWNAPDVNFTFDYTESQPLDYSPNSFNSHLVSVLAFYANLITGLDFDSFSPLGGREYLNEALSIAQSAQQRGIGNGWEQFANTESRYAIIQSILNAQLEPVRQAVYQYHREGLDMMYDDPAKARANILEALKKIQKVSKLNPNEPFLKLLIQTKIDEIVSIYSEGDLQVRRQVYNIMKEIAPANSDRYDSMIK